MEKVTKLNRFTTLPVLLDLLRRKKLTLLDPESWEDKNDSEIISKYKKRKRIENLFAICFSHGDETIHHWKAFADGPAGCVIEFDPQKLFKSIESHIKNIPGLRLRKGKVRYRKIKNVERNKIHTDNIPFTKRLPYQYRIIVENTNNTNNKDEKTFDIPIPLDIIKKITFSQHMPKPIFKTIRDHLRGIEGVPSRVNINRSTLYNNKDWINSFKDK